MLTGHSEYRSSPVPQHTAATPESKDLRARSEWWSPHIIEEGAVHIPEGKKRALADRCADTVLEAECAEENPRGCRHAECVRGGRSTANKQEL